MTFVCKTMVEGRWQGESKTVHLDKNMPLCHLAHY